MTQMRPRIQLPELPPKEQEAQRRRRLEAIEKVREIRERILAYNEGKPIDVDALLDEMRGHYPDER